MTELDIPTPAGVTPSFSLPYPEATDPVSAGAANMRALALAVDALISKTVRGVSSVTITAGVGTLTVTYPAGSFPTPPTVHAVTTLITGNVHFIPGLTAQSATGCTMRLAQNGGGTAGGTIQVFWAAVWTPTVQAAGDAPGHDI